MVSRRGAGSERLKKEATPGPGSCKRLLCRRWVQPGYIGDRRPGTWVTLLLTPCGGGAMPWQETNAVLERHHFAQDLESGHWTMTELCLRYGISRNIGYKWLRRQAHNRGWGGWGVNGGPPP